MALPENALAVYGDHPFANSAGVEISLKGGRVLLPTSDHAYYLARFELSESDTREAIINADSPAQARSIAREHGDKVRVNWEDIRLRVMTGVIRLKFRQHDELQKQLLETGESYIYADARKDAPENVDDDGTLESMRFWGVLDGEGENWIGNILMDIRSDLQEGKKI